jgi:protein-S-isoprenylcysteine O-methyltransferase Ste14
VEFIAVIGLVLQNLGWWTLFILAVHLPILLIRMNYEEKVLTAEFPEYTKYKRKTKRLIPYVF